MKSVKEYHQIPRFEQDQKVKKEWHKDRKKRAEKGVDFYSLEKYCVNCRRKLGVFYHDCNDSTHNHIWINEKKKAVYHMKQGKYFSWLPQEKEVVEEDAHRLREEHRENMKIESEKLFRENYTKSKTIGIEQIENITNIFSTGSIEDKQLLLFE